jgi:hypothetical protein
MILQKIQAAEDMMNMCASVRGQNTKWSTILGGEGKLQPPEVIDMRGRGKENIAGWGSRTVNAGKSPGGIYF